MKLRQVIYASQARSPFDSDRLESLLEQSRADNRAANITGLLIYHDKHFFQVIEGPDDAIGTTYRRIRRDPRHGNIRDLVDSAIARREYGDWSMGLLDWSGLAGEAAGFMSPMSAAPAGFGGQRSQLILSRFARGDWRQHVAG